MQQCRSGSVGQQWHEALDPALDGRVVDLHAAFGEQFLDVAVGEAETEVPADRQDDHVGWEAESRRTKIAGRAERGRRVLIATVCRLRARSPQMQQCPATWATIRGMPIEPEHCYGSWNSTGPPG